MIRLLVGAPTFALFLLGVVPPAPVVAYNGQDVAGTPLSGWSVTGAGPLGPSDCGECFDEDETTFDIGSFNGSPSVHPMAVTWTKSGSGGTFTVESFRFNVGACTSGWPYTGGNCGTGGTPADITRIVIMCTPANQNGSYDAQYVVYDANVSGFHGGHDTDQVDLDDPCVISQATGTPDAGETRRMWIRLTLSGAPDIMWKSLQFFDDGVSIPTVFEEYVYGLALRHPPFERRISWWWAQTWEGDWWVTDSDDTELARGTEGEQGLPEFVQISCVPVCGDDTYTIHVQPDGQDEATYSIGSDLDGYAIPPVTHGIFSYAEACYNSTTDECPGELAGVADSMYFRFTVVRPGTDTNGSNIDGVISFGRFDRTNPEPCQFVGSEVSTGVLDFPATYTQGVTAWAEGAGFFNADGDQEVLLLWQSQLDPSYFTCYRLAVDVTGGVVTTRENPVSIVTPCGATDLACAVGRAVGVALDAIFGAAEDVWSSAVEEVHDRAAEKLPFAYVVLAFDGISAQLERAALEVESSDDCPGVTFQVPLYYGTSPMTPTPTNVPITVMTCAQLEPVMGTTWYQAVRVALDPALWILFGWSQLKALQPRTSLNG